MPVLAICSVMSSRVDVEWLNIARNSSYSGVPMRYSCWFFPRVGCSLVIAGLHSMTEELKSSHAHQHSCGTADHGTLHGQNATEIRAKFNNVTIMVNKDKYILPVKIII